MRSFLKLLLIAVPLFVCGSIQAQDKSPDAFASISKYISQGNAEALSAWFADNLEITVLSRGGTSSKAQAKQILKSFFETYTPRKFEISHIAGRPNMKYALGTLNAGGETFNVTIFVSVRDGDCKIQQLKIERVQ